MEVKGMYEVKTLETKSVDSDVKQDRFGNYNLGILSEDGEFIIRYVGRSDTCLNSRLKKWCGKRYYTHYTVTYPHTIKQCFEIECRDFHLLNNQIDNIIHPRKPRLLDIFSCPWCKPAIELPIFPNIAIGGVN
jgi:hypothetical protein